jgi:hypothetical protein
VIGTNNQQLITNVMSSFTRDNEQLVDQVMKISHYGRLTRDDTWALSPTEREKYADFLNTRFEEANKLMSKGISVLL